MVLGRDRAQDVQKNKTRNSVWLLKGKSDFTVTGHVLLQLHTGCVMKKSEINLTLREFKLVKLIQEPEVLSDVLFLL